jgi:HK97 family phage prohead protease
VSVEFRWDGAQAEKNLGSDPSKAQISALFAIPRDTKSDSSLPHHSVSADGTVGSADKDGCTAAIAALNGGRGGVSAGDAEKNRAYSHLASHLRAMGVDPPAKQFAAARAGLELRAQRRMGMLRVPERIALQFGASGVEMRAKANGTGGTKFHFTGYPAVYDYPFEMWDFWGDPFTEKVAQLSGARTLANGCDVPFLVGHNDAGIPMARTKSGTMTLGEDSHGLHVDAPDLDGGLEQIRQLASAVERGDMDEMSMAFVTIRQDWSPDYEQRTILEYDLHKGDVSVVVFGANDGTAGSSMVALPAEGLMLRRPTGIRQARAGEARRLGESGTPDYDPQPHADPAALHCPSSGCTVEGGAMNSPDAKNCDQCGAALYDADGKIIIDSQGIPEEAEGDGPSSLALRQRQLELLKLVAS